MGVNGLESLIRENVATSSTHEKPLTARFDALISSQTGIVSTLARVLIDASAIINAAAETRLEQNQCGYLLPTYDWVDDWVSQLHAAFVRENIQPVWYFETSSATDEKIDTLKIRMQKNIDDRMLPMMGYLTGQRRSFTMDHNMLLPSLISWQVKISLARLGVCLVNCAGEADPEMIKTYNEFTDLAILSQDSDFFCSGTRYMPLRDTKGILPGQLDEPLFGTLYTPSVVSALLGLRQSDLSAFSTLAGNDYSAPILNVYTNIYAILGITTVLQGPLHWSWKQRLPAVIRWILSIPSPLDLAAILLDKQQVSSFVFDSAEPALKGLNKLRAVHIMQELYESKDMCLDPGPALGISFTELSDLIKTRMAPSDVLGLFYTHRTSLSVVYELDSKDLLLFKDFAFPLLAAKCLLLGHNQVYIRI